MVSQDYSEQTKQDDSFSVLSPLSSALLYSLKKSGISTLLFKNEDRRDFSSFSYKKAQKNFSSQSLVQSRTEKQALQNVTSKSIDPAFLAPEKNVIQKDIPTLSSYIQPHNLQSPHQQDKNLPSKPIVEQSITPKKKNKTIVLEDWPLVWKEMHTRFSLPSQENTNSKVRVAWTYEGLEQDALGIANKERQTVMKQILTALNHKKGTHTFIPYSIPHEDGISRFALHEEASFFWSAMRLLKPRILLVFGSSARDALHIANLRPLQKIDMGGLRILQMHKPETLVTQPVHLAATLAFLQDSLRICATK